MWAINFKKIIITQIFFWYTKSAEVGQTLEAVKALKKQKPKGSDD